MLNGRRNNDVGIVELARHAFPVSAGGEPLLDVAGDAVFGGTGGELRRGGGVIGVNGGAPSGDDVSGGEFRRGLGEGRKSAKK